MIKSALNIENKNRRLFIYWGIPIILSISVYFLLYVSSNFEDETYSTAVLVYFVVNGLMVALISKKIFARYREDSKYSGVYYFITAIVTGVFLYMVLYFLIKTALIKYTGQDDSIGYKHMAFAFVQGSILNIIISGSQYLLLFINSTVAARLRAERLENENNVAQLSALKLQLSPHFLFNNFNTLDGLIQENPKEAQEFLHELSDLFRSILTYNKQDLISLRDELKLINHFNFLVQKRFGPSYKCLIQIDDEDLNKFYLPPMSLQILVENSIQHNAISTDSILVCEIRKEGERMIVSNATKPKSYQISSTKIGIENLKRRYKFLTDEEVIISQSETKFSVSIPLLQVENYGQE